MDAGTAQAIVAGPSNARPTQKIRPAFRERRLGERVVAIEPTIR
jgi:hypothetical protein